MVQAKAAGAWDIYFTYGFQISCRHTWLSVFKSVTLVSRDPGKQRDFGSIFLASTLWEDTVKGGWNRYFAPIYHIHLLFSVELLIPVLL